MQVGRTSDSLKIHMACIIYLFQQNFSRLEGYLLLIEILVKYIYNTLVDLRTQVSLLNAC